MTLELLETYLINEAKEFLLGKNRNVNTEELRDKILYLNAYAFYERNL